MRVARRASIHAAITPTRTAAVGARVGRTSNRSWPMNREAPSAPPNLHGRLVDAVLPQPSVSTRQTSSLDDLMELSYVQLPPAPRQQLERIGRERLSSYS